MDFAIGIISIISKISIVFSRENEVIANSFRFAPNDRDPERKDAISLFALCFPSTHYILSQRISALRSEISSEKRLTKLNSPNERFSLYDLLGVKFMLATI